VIEGMSDQPAADDADQDPWVGSGDGLVPIQVGQGIESVVAYEGPAVSGERPGTRWYWVVYGPGGVAG
jgi:hypothetical protein